MAISSHRPIALLILLTAVDLTAAQAPRRVPSGTRETIDQHLERGAGLEKIGLYKEAEAEFLAALAVASPAARGQIAEALQRVREAQRSAESAKADQRSDKHFQLAEELQRQGQYDEAMAEFQRAYNEADSPEARARAQAAVLRVLEEKNSFWQRLIRDWLVPAAKAVVLLAASVLLLLPGLRIIYRILGLVGRSFARFSKRIELADFEDTTDTGFGKGFPALLRALYHERQQLAQRALTLRGSGIVTYRREHAADPIMGSRKYEDFSEMKLDIAGVAVSELLAKLTRLLFQPYYSVSGVVYRYNNEVRAAATLAKYNGVLEHWDFTLSDGQPGGPIPSDPAYQLINAIITDWEQR
jgi:tetratricopeptide (TPR) repeat protein